MATNTGVLFAGLKQCSCKPRLSDDAQQRTTLNRIMKRNRNSYGCPLNPFLHNPMTTVLTDGKESMVFENTANFRARKDSKPTQPEPQFA
jgi:hypothetical protein